MLHNRPGVDKLSTAPRLTLRKMLSDDVEHKVAVHNQARAKRVLTRIANEMSLLKQLKFVKANFEIMHADAKQIAHVDAEIKKLEKFEFDEKSFKTPRESYRHRLAKKLFERIGKKNLKNDLKKYYQQIESTNLNFSDAAVSTPWWQAIENLCKSKINETDVETSILDKTVVAFNARPSKLEMRDHLSKDMRDYLYVKDKGGGATNPGLFGGEFICCYAVNGEVYPQRALIKQDTSRNAVTRQLLVNHNKNITEYVLGRLMNRFIDDSAASVNLVRAPWQQDGTVLGPIDEKTPPDQSGNNTYVLSIFYDEFNELYKELYQEEGKEPPAARPRYIGTVFQQEFTDIFKAHLMNQDVNLPDQKSHCRYLDFNSTTVASLLGNDFDAHTANYGVLPVKRANGDLVPLYETTGKFMTKSGQFAQQGDFVLDADGLVIPEYKRDHAGKLIPIFMKNRAGDVLLDEAGQPRQAIQKKLVRIDFGGAMKNHWLFGGMEDNVHMHSHRKHPPIVGPTNHIREFSRLLKVNPRFAAELERQGYHGAYDKKTVTGWIDDIMKDVAKAYGAKPIQEFAANMGLSLDVAIGKDAVVAATTQFLTEKMLARQISLTGLALEIRMSYATEFADGKIKQNADLDKLICENPNYFSRGKYHFRHPRQQWKEPITGGAITTRKWEWRQHARERMYAYMDQLGLKQKLGVMEMDVYFENIVQRGEIFLARLQILARFAKDEAERIRLLEQAADLRRWIDKYSAKDSADNAGLLTVVLDAAFREIKTTYESTLVREPKIKKLMDIKAHFKLSESSEERDRYVETFKTIAQSGQLPWESASVAATPSATASSHYPSARAYSPHTLFTPQTFDYENADNITLATAIALQSVVVTLNQTILALAALQRTLDAHYGVKLAP